MAGTARLPSIGGAPTLIRSGSSNAIELMEASMYARLVPAISALALVTACSSPSPGGVDTEGPRIRLTLLNGYARPVFDSTIAPAADEDRCGKVADFPGTPARVAVSLSDPGGLDRVSIRALAGDIIDSSVVAAPDWTVTNRMDGGVDTTEIAFRRGGSESVLTHALVVLDVTSATQGVAVGTEAHDIAGNRTTLYQVDIRPLTDPIVCWGGR